MHSFATVAAVFLVLLPAVQAHDDLTALSDEFDDSLSLVHWRSLWQTEGWGANQLLTRDINTTEPGRLVLVPHASTWYRDWRGVLEYKDLTGDFVVTTDVEPRRRSGAGAPQSAFSLAGIMVRAPRNGVTSPATWTPGGENYVFLSLGTGDSPGQFQFEVKTTLNSDSVLHLSPGVARARIQVARIGTTFVMLRQNDGGPWVVHQRYAPSGFPVCRAGGAHHLHRLAHSFPMGTAPAQPDGAARRQPGPGRPCLNTCASPVPVVPISLQGRDLSNPASVSDAELTVFLGAAANIPGGSTQPSTLLLQATGAGETLECVVSGLQPDRSYRLESTTDWITWNTMTHFLSASGSHQISLERDSPARFLRVVSP
jgi:hypothetical protein